MQESKDISWDEIESIEEIGEDDCLDITLLETDGILGEGNFLAADFIVHNCGMHETFIRRKKGREKYELHPLMQSYLGYTYGVMAYQEQVLQILINIGGVPKALAEKVRKSISKKKIKEFIGHKANCIRNFMVRLGYTQEPAEDLWQQIESFSEYGFNKSHAYAYTYISSRLLYLKAHHPLEFYCATLQIEDDADKVKQFKLEAEKNGIKVNKLDLNKSDWTFSIKDGEIYIGFSNVKGIGEAVARRIVAGQPYASFEDFLRKFGTASVALKPLIGLGAFDCFGETDRCRLWEFAEHYKSVANKIVSRDSRAIDSRSKIVSEMCKLVRESSVKRSDEGLFIEYEQPSNPDDLCVGVEAFMQDAILHEDEKSFAGWMHGGASMRLPGVEIKASWKIVKKYKTNIANLAKKQAEDKEVTLAEFVATGDIDEKLKNVYTDIPTAAEVLWYGYGWKHMLEYSPDFEGGRSLLQFEDENKMVMLCEMMVTKPAEKKISKSNNAYYVLTLEDANFQVARVNIWEDDYRRFQEEFTYFDNRRKCGHMMRIRLERPSGGFPTFKFDCPPKHLRHKIIPKDKEKDYRLILMSPPPHSVHVSDTDLNQQNIVEDGLS